jgi:Domain of unknown function (DUF1707)
MCHSRHTYVPRTERAEVVSEPLDLRASDAERERVVEALRTHAAAGRLSVEELEARFDRAYAAATRADLRRLLADLPATVVPVVPPRRGAAHEWQAWAAVAVLLLVIWAATGAGVFWPVWPIGFWALGLLLGRGAPLYRWERRRV